MYQPEAFRETNLATIYDIVEQFPFATIIIADRDILELTHVPIVLDRGSSPGLIRGHVARGNPIWHSFDGHRPCVMLFQGPHGYISPTWYPDRLEVPTWNYVVVHACGRPRILQSDAEIDLILSDLVTKHEAGSDRWRVSELPPSLYAALRAEIVGFEMAIDEVIAKCKLSQNRDEVTRHAIARGLRTRGEHELAKWIDRASNK